MIKNLIRNMKMKKLEEERINDLNNYYDIYRSGYMSLESLTELLDDCNNAYEKRLSEI